jgi:hypothetical protein
MTSFLPPAAVDLDAMIPKLMAADPADVPGLLDAMLVSDEQRAFITAGAWARVLSQKGHVKHAAGAMIAARQLYALAYTELQRALAAERPEPHPMTEDLIVQSAMHEAAKPFDQNTLIAGFMESVMPWLGDVADDLSRGHGWEDTAASWVWRLPGWGDKTSTLNDRFTIPSFRDVTFVDELQGKWSRWDYKLIIDWWPSDWSRPKPAQWTIMYFLHQEEMSLKSPEGLALLDTARSAPSMRPPRTTNARGSACRSVRTAERSRRVATGAVSRMKRQPQA